MKPSPLDELFVDPATQHRPTDRPSFRREAARLAATGLALRDVANALGLSENGVRDLLREHRAGQPAAWPW
jgi:DNA-binding NarL/FixJ family response regulator